MEFGAWDLDSSSMNTPSGRNLLFAGVGGQGVLLVAELAARTALLAGYDAKKTEVHGAAQRGGSVVSHVRFGPKIYSPLIPAGEVDILLALEKLEGLRWSHFVREGSLIILNDEERVPASLDSKPVEYPKSIDAFLSGKGFNTQVVDATAMATSLGNFRAANILLLGVIAQHTSLPLHLWKTVLKENLHPKILDLNLKAFEKGLELSASLQWANTSSH